MSLEKDIINVVKNVAKEKTTSYDVSAEVVRIEDSTVWVHIPGGVDETPIEKTINAKVGDIVKVRISGGRAWATGNSTAPPTDDTVANKAKSVAQVAEGKAVSAQKTAEEASGIAEEAGNKATIAEQVANSVSAVAQSAQETANEAQAVAQATGQHFWNISESEYFVSSDEYFVTWKTYYDPDTHAEITLPNEPHTLENTDTVTVDYNILRIISIENDGVKWDESIYSFSGNTITFAHIISGPIDVTIKYVPDVVPASLFWFEELGAGAYVTEFEQEPFRRHPSGKNSLWNSLGMLFRNGLNNLLSIVTGTVTGFSIFDGDGNSDENIVASFTDQGSVIGKINENRLEISPYKVEAKGLHNDTFWQVKDLRENNVTLLYPSDVTEGKTDFLVPCASEIVSVLIDGDPYDYYTFNDADTDEASISIDSAWSGHQLEITYTVSQSEDVHPYVFNFLNDTGAMQGAGSFNEGLNCYSMGAFSHTEGINTQTLSHACHTEGLDTSAKGMASHTEGSNTRAERDYSHAEGLGAVASGRISHAEGFNTEAGDYAHAEGFTSKATGRSSHAQNSGTKASSNDQTALGRYNVEDTNDEYAVIVGNGADENARSNALTLDWNGNVEADGDVIDGSGNVLSEKANTASLSAVATSGSYNDLSNKPTLVTGVKGNSESSYRTGNVNITPANIGAITGSGSHTTAYTSKFTIGPLTIVTGNVVVNVTSANTNTDKAVSFGVTFSHVPNIQVTMLNIGGSYYQKVTAAGPSITGFSVRVRAGGTPGDVNVNWMAVGKV